MWSFIALYNWKIQNIDEQNKYPLFYFPEILTQVIVCFDQARGQMLFPLYFTKICSPMWYGKFWPVHLWTNTWTVTASEILFVDGCRLQFSGCFNKYFLPHGGLSSLPSLPDTFSIKNVYWYYKYRPEEYLIFLYIYRVVIYIYYKALCVWLWHESIEFNISFLFNSSLLYGYSYKIFFPFKNREWKRKR